MEDQDLRDGVRVVSFLYGIAVTLPPASSSCLSKGHAC